MPNNFFFNISLKTKKERERLLSETALLKGFNREITKAEVYNRGLEAFKADLPPKQKEAFKTLREPTK